MKLIYKVAIRLSLIIMVLLALWTTIFYFTLVDEINDETDDALEDYAELIIMRVLAGEELPNPSRNASNNTHTIAVIDEAEANSREHIKYYDAKVFIPQKNEYEPARVLTMIFTDKDNIWYELDVAIPTFEREDLLTTVLGWILCLYVVILVTGVSVTMWVFHRSLTPLYDLLKWLGNYVPGHKTTSVPDDTNIKEFKQLNKAVEEATNRSEDAYNRQKEFIGNASHELQTPLAVLGNRIERMLNGTQLTEEQMEELVSMLQTQRHIVRLNKDLLLLTKIDNCQFANDNTDVDIVYIVKEQQAVYEEIFEEKGITCKINLAKSCVVRMNKSLAEVLIANLLRNAYIHSADNAFIDIDIFSNGIFSIANTGEKALDADAIFERFYQGAKKEGSTGLGLSIVKAICSSYDIPINYRYENKKHVFYINFLKN